MNSRHKLLQNLVSGLVRTALVMGTLMGVANLQASNSEMRGRISAALDTRAASQNLADNNHTLLVDGYAPDLNSLLCSTGPGSVREYLSALAFKSVRDDDSSLVTASYMVGQPMRFNGVIEKLRDYICESNLSTIATRLSAFSEKDWAALDNAKQIFLGLNDKMSRQATAAMSVLNRFIEPFLQDPVHEVAYILMNESFASASGAPGLVSQGINFFINYLVYGIGLEKVGKDKILKALEDTLASGDVNLSNFAFNLLDKVLDHICDSNLVHDDELGYENAKMIRDALKSCVMHSCEMVKNVYDITGSEYDMYVPFVKNWDNLDRETINKIKNFVLLILRYYSGQLSLKIAYENAIGTSSVFAKTQNDVLSEIKKYLVPQSNIASPSVEYFKDLPEEVRNFMRPYIMSIFSEFFLGMSPKDLDEEWNKIQQSRVGELKRRVHDINIDSVLASMRSYAEIKHKEDELLDDALNMPHEKLLKFWKYRNVGESGVAQYRGFNFDDFVDALSNCIDANSEWQVEIDGKMVNLADAMKLDAVDAMGYLAKSIESFLKETNADKSSSDTQAYLYMMNNFFASLSSRLYSVKNRIRSEDKDVNLIINYLVYSGCLEVSDIVDSIARSQGKGRVSLKDFAIILARRILCQICSSDETQLKAQIKNCFDHCQDSFKNWKQEKAGNLIECLIHRDKIVFIKDWWHVTEDELQKVRNFLNAVLNGCIKDYGNRTIEELPDGMRECIRPYINLSVTGDPFAEFNQVLKKKLNAFLLGPTNSSTVTTSQENLRFHLNMLSGGAPLSEGEQSFIAREELDHFYPVPLCHTLAKCYLPWVKEAVFNQLSSQDVNKKMKDFPDKKFLIPYIYTLAVGKYNGSDTFPDITVGEVIALCNKVE